MQDSKQSGIDISLGNSCSQIAFGWAKKTFTNREPGMGNPLATIDGGFSSIMDYQGVRVGVSSDGVGTKIEIAERTGIYITLGWDLIGMVADDLIANGVETVNLSNILDVDFLDSEIVDQLMRGLNDAATYARITLTGGEIAELGGRIAGYGDRMHFNWCATGVGMLAPDKEIIDGRALHEGDAVIALKSRGFRSNGYSMIRKIMRETFGDYWHTVEYSPNQTWGEALLTPCYIFTPLIVDMMREGIDLRGIAHITGGGILDKFSRVLKYNKLGAVLDNVHEPHPYMIKMQQMGDLPDEKAYRLWNMGNAMLIVLPPDHVNAAIQFIEKNDYRGQVCGSIVLEPTITLETRGWRPTRIVHAY
jgi:phosphoribosylformylglycinamidine cyclo-ligase